MKILAALSLATLLIPVSTSGQEGSATLERRRVFRGESAASTLLPTAYPGVGMLVLIESDRQPEVRFVAIVPADGIVTGVVLNCDRDDQRDNTQTTTIHVAQAGSEWVAGVKLVPATDLRKPHILSGTDGTDGTHAYIPTAWFRSADDGAFYSYDSAMATLDLSRVNCVSK